MTAQELINHFELNPPKNKNLLKLLHKTLAKQTEVKVTEIKVTKYFDKKVTVRANGKCHPAFANYYDGKFAGYQLLCSCPGSKNGHLANKCTFVADGFDAKNCR